VPRLAIELRSSQDPLIPSSRLGKAGAYCDGGISRGLNQRSIAHLWQRLSDYRRLNIRISDIRLLRGKLISGNGINRCISRLLAAGTSNDGQRQKQSQSE
jgi:hypothetical protein